MLKNWFFGVLSEFSHNDRSKRRRLRQWTSRDQHHLESLETRVLLAAELEPVLDANASIRDFTVAESSVTALGDHVYFIASTPTTGSELWRTDGTSAGTELFREFWPGPLDGISGELIVFNDELYFAAHHELFLGSYSKELWKTDGTFEGTVQVSEFSDLVEAGTFLGDPRLSPHDFEVVDQTLFFNGRKFYPFDSALWKSDGTTEGTVRVDPTATGGIDSIRNVVGHGIHTYFIGDTFFGDYLYRASQEDGSYEKVAATTTENLVTRSIYSVGNHLLTISYQPSSGAELWVVSETGELTPLPEIVPGTGSPEIADVRPFGDQILFTANDGIHGDEVWISDGTAAGTRMVKDIRPGAEGGLQQHWSGRYAEAGDLAYFIADDGVHGAELWSTDGTEAGTDLVVDGTSGAGSSFNHNSRFLSIGGRAFFVFQGDFWTADGTPDGLEPTASWLNAIPGTPTNSIGFAQGNFYVEVLNESGAQEFWQSNADGSLTTNLGKFSGTGDRAGAVPFYSGNDAVFTAGETIYAFDGTSTREVATIAPKTPADVVVFYSELENVRIVGELNNHVIVSATTYADVFVDGEFTEEYYTHFYRIDVSASEVNSITELDGVELEGGAWSNVGNELFYSVIDTDSTQLELWAIGDTDWTPRLVKEFNVNPYLGSVYAFAGTPERFFLLASEVSTGQELWLSDGTTEGTNLVVDLTPGSDGSSISDWLHVDGQLYFAYDDGISGRELWVSDGTAPGTRRVADINPGSDSSAPRGLTIFGESIVFSAETIDGRELWITDGTESGTMQIVDLSPGAVSSSPNNFGVVNGELIFTATTTATGSELWKSDGTAAGTAVITDFDLSSQSSVFSGTPTFTTADLYYFVMDHPGHGFELWQTDGSAGGTEIVADVTGDARSSSPQHIWAQNGQVLVTATTDAFGTEIYQLRERQQPALGVIVTNTADSGPGSLRQAILDANAATEDVTISFAIPDTDLGFVDVDSALSGGDAAADVFRIQPLTPLPAINNINAKAVTIDATSQQSLSGNTNTFGPEIELDGSLAGTGFGLHLISDDLSIRGLVVNQFSSSGVVIDGSGAIVVGNFVGTDATGTRDLGNGSHGIEVRNGSQDVRIGGTSVEDRNVVSGNGGHGVSFSGVSDAVVTGNHIGTTADGSAALGNGAPTFNGDGVNSFNSHRIRIGGPDAADGNLISGNEGSGIFLQLTTSSDVTIQNNVLGTDITGTASLGRQENGIRAENSVGLTARDNLISGNLSTGIGATNIDGFVISGNQIGTTADGNGAISTHTHGIEINRSKNVVIGGDSVADGNQVSGNKQLGIRTLGEFDSLVVQNNRVGTNLSGDAAVPNGSGLSISASRGRGITVSDNLISGNTETGLSVFGDAAETVSVTGNHVGTNAAGDDVVPNGRPGIWLQQASGIDVSNNVSVGSPNSSGLIVDGSRDVTVSGNYLGVLGDGVTPAGNDGGLYVFRSFDVDIEDNTISGNRLSGVRIQESAFEPLLVQWSAAEGGNDHWYWVTPDRRTWQYHDGQATALGAYLASVGSVQENTFLRNLVVDTAGWPGGWIGLNDWTMEGTYEWSSGEPLTYTNWNSGQPSNNTGENGIVLWNNSAWYDEPNTTAYVGIVEFETEPDPAALIASYGHIKLTNNRIGIGADGVTPVPNQDGFDISDSDNVIIGGSNPADANIIAHNTNDGVHIRNVANVTVTGNSIFANGDEGIDLAPQGATANDPLDADTGPNGLQNYPVLDAVTYSSTSATIFGSLHSTPDSQFEIEVFSNSTTVAGDAEGELFVGRISVTTDSNGDASFSLVTASSIPPNQFLTATATDTNGNTSEFSSAFLAAAKLSLTIDAASTAEDGTATATVTRNTDVSADLDVMVLVDDDTELKVPLFVTIPAGSDSIQFAVSGINDHRVDGTQVAKVSVMADGLMSADATLSVTDINTAGVVITQNAAGVHVYEGADITEPPTVPQDWGINLSFNVDWSTSVAWVDVSKLFRAWGNVDAPWQEQVWTQPLTNEGVPQEDFGTIVANGGGGIPLGRYTLQFDGTANVTAHGGWSIVAGSVQKNGNTTTMTIDVHTLENMWMKFRNVTTADPVRGISMAAEGTDRSTAGTFSEEYLRRLQPFSTIRFMNWNQTNNSHVTNWEDRRLPSETIQTGGDTDKGGVAWEYMIQLANETQKDAWINIPHKADDNYVRELARLWRDNLDPNLTLYVEWSNETWNSIFNQYGGADGSRDGHDYYLDGNAGPETVRISNIFREEFSGQTDRLHVTLAGQSANNWVAGRGIQYMVDQGLVPSDVIDSVSIAPYFSIPNNSTATNLDQLFAELTQRTSDLQNHATLAETYGLELIAYEGGQHLAPNIHTNVPRDVLDASQHDQRMADAYREFANIWKAAGGGLFNHYSFIRADANSGYWGLLEHGHSPGDVKWDATLGVILPKGDASLNGTVDFGDFQTVQANFGQSGMWWEQGDFNGDNVVDGADLQLLYANGTFSAPETTQVINFAEANSVPLFDHYTVALSSIPTSPVTITLNINEQLTTSTQTVTFAADESALIPQTIYVTATDDSVLEGDHFSVIHHEASSNDVNFDRISVEDVSIELFDNEVGTVSIEATTDANEAGSRNGRFAVRIDQPAAVDVDVSYSVGGSASAGSDYTALTGIVTIAAGTTSANIDIAVIDDGFAENVENVSIALTETSLGQNAVVNAEAAVASASIFSDDQNVIKVSVATVTVSEDGTTATFGVTLGAQPSGNVVVNVASDDTGEVAVSGATVTAGRLTFNAANWNVPQFVTVTGVDDAIVDGDQSVDVTLSVVTSLSAPEFRFSPTEQVDVLNTDNDEASAVVKVEDITFYHRNAAAEDGLSPNKTGQRSIVRHVQVVLDGDVSFTAGTVSSSTFTVNNLTARVEVGVVVDSVVQTGGRTIVVLSFANGSSVINGGLIDGNYELIIDGSAHGFDADGSGTVGSTRTTRFHRLFGDTDGDRDVDNADYGNLYRAFYGDTAYRSVFDRDDDDDLFDEIGSFFSNYGRRLIP